MITIVDTKTYGKFVLHHHPPPPFITHLSADLHASLTSTFDYFGLYDKVNLIPTSTDSLNEKTVINMFIANEKFSQIVVGIQEDCVLISKSAFVKIEGEECGSTLRGLSSGNAEMSGCAREQESEINSLSLLAYEKSYDRMEEIKHKLAFLVGVLVQKEKRSRFVTRGVHEAMRQKGKIQQKIKKVCATPYPEDNRTKAAFREMEEYSQSVLNSIPMFNFLKEFYINCFQLGKEMKISDEDADWEGTVGCRVDTSSQNEQAGLEYRCLVVDTPKLKEWLPRVLVGERMERVLACLATGASIRDICGKGEMSCRQMQHSVHFLLRNHLALSVYPIIKNKLYSFFTLKELPSLGTIEKFNRSNKTTFFENVSLYSSYRSPKQDQLILKYFLVRDIVREVGIYIYGKGGGGVGGVVEKYAMRNVDMNYIISVQGVNVNQLIKFIRSTPSYGFYYVE